MSEINDRTPNLNLAQPHPDNDLIVDVLRIRESFSTLDVAVDKLAQALGDDPDFATTISNNINAKAGNRRSVSILGASTVLTASHLGQYITLWGNSTPITLTLPAPSASAAGNLIIHNVSVHNCMIAASSLGGVRGNGTSVTIYSGTSVEVVCDGFNWFINEGMNAAALNEMLGYTPFNLANGLTANLDCNNKNITEVNTLSFNTPNAGQGLRWAGTNPWRQYEASGDMHWVLENVGMRMAVTASGSLTVNSPARGLDGLGITSGNAFIRAMANMSAGGYNSSFLAGECAVVYSNGVLGQGTLRFAPWSNSLCSFSLDANANPAVLNDGFYLTHVDTSTGLARYLHSNDGNMGFLNSAGSWMFCSKNDGTFDAWCGDAARPASFCRASVNFNGQGTLVVRKGFNVLSVIDNGGTGSYTVNFATAMPANTYSVVATCGMDGLGTASAWVLNVGDYTTSSFKVYGRTVTPAAADIPIINVAVFY